MGKIMVRFKILCKTEQCGKGVAAFLSHKCDKHPPSFVNIFNYCIVLPIPFCLLVYNYSQESTVTNPDYLYCFTSKSEAHKLLMYTDKEAIYEEKIKQPF